MTSRNGTDVDQYTYVRVWASAVAFVVLAFFNIVINWTILREEQLRNHARFVLVFYLLSSSLVHFAVCFAFYLQIYLRASIAASACEALITILATSASSILLTLTAMALDRYCAICFPLKYGSVCFKQWPWFIGILTWGIACIIPLCLFPKSLEILTTYRQCGRTQLKGGGELLKIVLISVCTILILYSYVRILLEGRKLGVLNRGNRVGRKTIALHGTQLAVYILPNFINFVLHVLNQKDLLDTSTKGQFAVINFAFFSLAQCIAPAVYGLRKEELLEHLRNRFPCLTCHMKSVLEWTVRVARPNGHHQPRSRRPTAEALMSGKSQTSV